MKSNTYHRTVFTLLIALFMLGCAHQEPISPQQTDGMVVAAHPQAAELGYDILKAGGNAVDAAVGTAIALSVVEPHASGLGGGGGMLIYLNDQDKLTYINYYPQTGAVPPDTFISRTDAHTAGAVLVPGTVAGLSMALSLYGTMSWEDILLLSIDRLKAGFIIDSKFNKVILDSYEVLMEYTETSDIFLNEMLRCLNRVMDGVIPPAQEEWYISFLIQKRNTFIGQTFRQVISLLARSNRRDAIRFKIAGGPPVVASSDVEIESLMLRAKSWFQSTDRVASLVMG